PVENIIGRAIALVWPTDRARELEIPASFDVLEGTGGQGGGTVEDPQSPQEPEEAAAHWSGSHALGGSSVELPPAVVPAHGARPAKRPTAPGRRAPAGLARGSRASPRERPDP